MQDLPCSNPESFKNVHANSVIYGQRPPVLRATQQEIKLGEQSFCRIVDDGEHPNIRPFRFRRNQSVAAAEEQEQAALNTSLSS